MKNKQGGQALIEFVIILPVIILLIFSFIDLGRIVLENNRLENITTMVIDKYDDTQKYDDISSYLKENGYSNIDLSISLKDELLTVKLDRDIDILTPGLGQIIGNPYRVKVERVVKYEK